MEDLLEKLVDQGLSLGADFIDLRLEKAIGTSIKIVDSKLKVGATFDNKGIAIRAFYDGAWGFVSSSVIKFEKLKEYVKDAVKMAKGISQHSKIKFKLNEQNGIKKKFPLKVKIRISDIDISEKIEFLEKIDKQARSYDNRIVNTNSVYSDSESYRMICNSFGSLIEAHESYVYCVSLNFSKENNVRQRGFKSVGKTLGYETIQTDEAQNLGIGSAKEAIELLKAKPAKGGTFTVLLDPKLAGVFIHESFGHAAEADAVIAGQSILENKIGEKIATDLLNVVDDPTLFGMFGSYQVDDECFKAKRTLLIENGILKNYLHNLETSSRLNMSGNNGRAEGFHYFPIVRMSNTHILPGNWKLEEMLEDIKTGIYAQGWIRGYTDPSTGAFMFKCARANIIQNGEIGELLRDAAISGDTLTTSVARSLRKRRTTNPRN
ncbi:MAG: TldD/PmbA family protein [Candidatus Helarchaeota archaeon]